MIACVIGNSAHAPSNTYAYAQLQQIGAVVGTIESGEWVLPRDQSGALARKPQLYAWIDAPVLMLTGLYNDFTFRFPTVMASFVTGVLVYLLGRRWYGRTGGLLAACLWASIHHMSKLTYVAVTDMLLTMFITASIFCADRLLFHRTARSRRTPWVIALWATMILGALSKGWGVVNLVLVGGTLGVATAVIPGFGVLGAVKGAGRKLSLAVRLVLRRWRRAARATRLGWGMLAMVGVLAPVWIAMRLKGGEEFHKIVYYEFYSRITGRGDVVPHSSSAPPILHLLYYMFPATVFAIGAMVLSGPRRWFSRTSPIAIPLIWIAAVVVPFSLAHGFRPDYLLPAYAAGALMGAWAIEEVHRRARQGGRTVSGLRHSFAAASIIICLSLIVVPAIYLLHEHVPRAIAKNFRLPAVTAPETWWILTALIPIGALGLAATIRASLRWRIRTLAAIAIVAMLGVMFVDRHFITRSAVTGDGERMVRFARTTKQIIGVDRFAVARARKLATALYLGRFGENIFHGLHSPYDADLDTQEAASAFAQERARVGLERLAGSDAVWLVTCDKGLVELGAGQMDESGPYTSKLFGRKVRFRTYPERLGELEISTEPVVSQRWGRMYLIRLDPIALQRRISEKMYLGEVLPAFSSGKQGRTR